MDSPKDGCGRKQTTCHCFRDCTEITDKEFQKIVELKDAGVALYRYVPPNLDPNQNIGKLYILRTDNDVELEPDEFTMTFAKNKISCPRCIKLIEKAEKLFKVLPFVKHQDVAGVCDHCWKPVAKLRRQGELARKERDVKEPAATVQPRIQPAIETEDVKTTYKESKQKPKEKEEQPIEKEEHPMTYELRPTAKEEGKKARAERSKDETPKAKVEKIIVKEEKPISKVDTSKEKKDISRDIVEKTKDKEEKTKVKEEKKDLEKKTTLKEEKSKVKEEKKEVEKKPSVKEEKPKVTQEKMVLEKKPSAKEEKPKATEEKKDLEKKPSVKEEKPKATEEKKVLEEKTTAKEEKSKVTEEKKDLEKKSSVKEEKPKATQEKKVLEKKTSAKEIEDKSAAKEEHPKDKKEKDTIPQKTTNELTAQIAQEKLEIQKRRQQQQKDKELAEKQAKEAEYRLKASLKEELDVKVKSVPISTGPPTADIEPESSLFEEPIISDIIIGDRICKIKEVENSEDGLDREISGKLQTPESKVGKITEIDSGKTNKAHPNLKFQTSESKKVGKIPEIVSGKTNKADPNLKFQTPESKKVGKIPEIPNLMMKGDKPNKDIQSSKELGQQGTNQFGKVANQSNKTTLEISGPNPPAPGNQKTTNANTSIKTENGIIRYCLSDRLFIEKGWTMLPSEKVVRKMNVYRMTPAHPEFDWFERHKNRRLLEYDSGEKLAEIDDSGRGRWFYRSGKLALDYYDAEEVNAGQRYVVYSTGTPDDRGRPRPRTVLATFDYLGNGIVFDHAGKIRLKYNQTEGVVLDRELGPVSHWKWHTLNDPPVLQQVMIDTQVTHKDPKIMSMGGAAVPRMDHDDMIAIEFENFVKEKTKKSSQNTNYKPFQIRMKALKINEYFSLRVMDQASVYLVYRDGSTNMKVNLGMVLNHREIVDTDTAEIGDVSNKMNKLPACTNSIKELQACVAHARTLEGARAERSRRILGPGLSSSVDRMRAPASRPPRPLACSVTSHRCATPATHKPCSCHCLPIPFSNSFSL